MEMKVETGPVGLCPAVLPTPLRDGGRRRPDVAAGTSFAGLGASKLWPRRRAAPRPAVGVQRIVLASGLVMLAATSARPL